MVFNNTGKVLPTKEIHLSFDVQSLNGGLVMEVCNSFFLGMSLNSYTCWVNPFIFLFHRGQKEPVLTWSSHYLLCNIMITRILCLRVKVLSSLANIYASVKSRRVILQARKNSKLFTVLTQQLYNPEWIVYEGDPVLYILYMVFCT